MLKNIPKILSPELLKIMAEMGHGDELVIGDANFPAQTCGKRVVRADGIGGAELLEAILKLMPLDTYAPSNFMLMQTVEGDEKNPAIWDTYRKIADRCDGHVREAQIERFAFYDRAEKAYAVVASGEERIYANVIIKKGVISQ